MPVYLQHLPARKKKHLFCRADPPLLLPAVVSSDLRGRGLSLESVRIWLGLTWCSLSLEGARRG